MVALWLKAFHIMLTLQLVLDIQTVCMNTANNVLSICVTACVFLCDGCVCLRPSACLSFCLPARLFVSLPASSPTCIVCFWFLLLSLFFVLFFSLFACLTVYLPRLSSFLPACLPACTSVRLPACLPVCLPTCNNNISYSVCVACLCVRYYH